MWWQALLHNELPKFDVARMCGEDEHLSKLFKLKAVQARCQDHVTPRYHYNNKLQVGFCVVQWNHSASCEARKFERDKYLHSF